MSANVQQTLAEMRAAIAELPEDDRVRIEAIAMVLRNAVKLGRGHGRCAFALVGAELEVAERRRT